MRVGTSLEACLARDVVRFDVVDGDADESEQERGKHARPILSARAVEEDAAIRFGQDADSLGETRSVEIECLAVQQPMLLRVVEASGASKHVRAVLRVAVEVIEQRQSPVIEVRVRRWVRRTLRFGAQIENRPNAVLARSAPPCGRELSRVVSPNENA
jgi:hypothetical protein